MRSPLFYSFIHTLCNAGKSGKKYGSMCEDVSVAVYLNLAGSLSNHATFESWKLPQHLT